MTVNAIYGSSGIGAHKITGEDKTVKLFKYILRFRRRLTEVALKKLPQQENGAQDRESQDARKWGVRKQQCNMTENGRSQHEKIFEGASAVSTTCRGEMTDASSNIPHKATRSESRVLYGDAGGQAI